MTSGGVECENDIASLTFDSDCENVFKKEMEVVMKYVIIIIIIIAF
jgi:hypothetical protein